MSNRMPNPFDTLRELVDYDKTFYDNVDKLYGMLTRGELDLQMVAMLLVEANALPSLLSDNAKLRGAVTDLRMKLESSMEQEQDCGTSAQVVN